MAIASFFVIASSTSLNFFTNEATAVAGSWQDAGNFSIAWYTNNATTHGSSSNPFLINTAQDLAGLAHLVNHNTVSSRRSFNNQHIKLTQDINLTAHAWVAIGMNGRTFLGNFNGDDRVVTLPSSLLTHNATGERNLGLFGWAGTGATIRNLILEGNVTNTPAATAGLSFNLAAFLGRSDAVILTNLVSRVNFTLTIGNVSHHFVAGILATCSWTTEARVISITNVANYGNITITSGTATSATSVAGIKGWSNSTVTITNAYNRGNLTLTSAATNAYVGGIFGGPGSLSNRTVVATNVFNLGTLQNTNHIARVGQIHAGAWTSGAGRSVSLTNAFGLNSNLTPSPAIGITPSISNSGVTNAAGVLTSMVNGTLPSPATLQNAMMAANGNWIQSLTPNIPTLYFLIPCTDNTLSNLAISGLPSTAQFPVFVPGTTNHTVTGTIPFLPQTTITLSAVPAGRRSTVTATLNSSPTSLYNIALPTGDNVIVITVQPQDTGTSSRSYTINIHRTPGSTNTNLESLEILAGGQSKTLTPTFSPTGSFFAIPNQPFSIQSVEIIAVTACAYAQIYNTGIRTINPGVNALQFTITPQDSGTPPRTITISVNRAHPSNDASLSSLTVFELLTTEYLTISPVFDPNHHEPFTATVGFQSTGLIVTALAYHDGATGRS